MRFYISHRRQSVGYRMMLVTIVALLLGAFAFVSVGESHGVIGGAPIIHDSHDDLYRLPGGAVPFGTEVTLRLSTGAGEVSEANMRLYDLRTRTQTILPMTRVATTPEGRDFWEVTFTAGTETTIYYYRFIFTMMGRTLYYEDDTVTDDGQYIVINKGGLGDIYTTSRDASYQIAVYDPEFYTPEWFRQGIVYQIFPDRFRDGDSSNNPSDGSEVFYGNLPLLFHETWNEPMVDGRVTRLPDGGGHWNSDFYGGDLAGVIEKLDYLQALGVSAIYLNPIFEARSNHRYDTADFLAVDPILGTMEDFEALVAEAASRGMYIILDGVFNHMSSDSALFDRYGRYETVGACESVDSPYRDWFYFREARGAESAMCDGEDGSMFYESWWGFDSIPKINNTLYGPRAYFVRGQDSVARFWGEAGIGGWRLDVAGDIDDGRDPANNYWESFRRVVRLVNSETVIIGEEWHDATPWLLGDEWDTVMNYRFRRAAIGLVRGANFVDGDGVIPALAPAQFDAVLRSIEEDYPPMAYEAMMNLLGSHDTSRIFFVMNNNVDLLKLSALLQFTLPGAPTVYYGDEIALDAPSKLDGALYQDDPYNRAPYPWADTDGDYYLPPNEDVLSFYQTLGQMYLENPALSAGTMVTLHADDMAGIYAFLRLYEGWNAVLVVVNTAADSRTVTLDLTSLLPENLMLDAVLASDSLELDSGMATVTVEGHSGSVWRAIVSTPLFAPPDETPSGVVAVGERGFVTVSWDAVRGAEGYIVYRSPVARGGFEPVSAVIAETTFTDENVTNGFVYYYAVAAVGEGGMIGALGEGVFAVPADEIASATFTAYVPPQTTITLQYDLLVPVEAAVVIDGVTGGMRRAPGIRAETALSAGGEDEVVQWQSMVYAGALDGNADVYETVLMPVSAGEFTILVRFSADAGQTWTQATFADGTLPVLIAEASDDAQPPAAPETFAIRQASLSGVVLEWTPVRDDDVAVYRLYRLLDGAETLLAELDTSAIGYTDTSVVAGNTYSYTLVVVDTALNESVPVSTRAVQVDRSLMTVTFLVFVPDYTDGTLYLAGDLGASTLPFWDPAGVEMTEIEPNIWAVTLDLSEGTTLEYKFARGSWDGVEKGSECEEITNRRLTISTDTLGEMQGDAYIVEHTIAKWRDLDSCP